MANILSLGDHFIDILELNVNKSNDLHFFVKVKKG